METDRTEHDSFGVVTLSRWTSGGKHHFFGSDLSHDCGVSLEVHEAYISETGVSEHIHPRRTILKVDMTEAQFGKMLTSFNIGAGTPVTIRHRQTGPIVEIARTPARARGDEIVKKARVEASEAAASLRKVAADLEDHIVKGGSKAQLKNILADLKNASGIVQGRLPWLVQRFAESMENLVTDAVASISSRKDAHVAQHVLVTPDTTPLVLEAPHKRPDGLL